MKAIVKKKPEPGLCLEDVPVPAGRQSRHAWNPGIERGH